MKQARNFWLVNEWPSTHIGPPRFVVYESAKYSGIPVIEITPEVKKKLDLHTDLVSLVREELEMFRAMPEHFKEKGTGNWLRWQQLEALIKRVDQ